MGQTPGSITIQKGRSDYLSSGQMLILRERHPVITRELLALAKETKWPPNKKPPLLEARCFPREEKWNRWPVAGTGVSLLHQSNLRLRWQVHYTQNPSQAANRFQYREVAVDMSKRPWFPLYVGDLLSDTMSFDATQFGGYIKILCHYWVTQEPMSVDEMRVASGLSKNIFQKSWPLLEKKFVY